MSLKTRIREWVKWHFLMERSIEKYVASLPRCSKYIVVSSPNGLYEGKCKVVLEASELFHCLEVGLIQEGFYAGVDEKVVKESIRIWLKGAEHTLYASVLFPEEMTQFLEAHFSRLIELKKAKVYCSTCYGYTSEVNEETFRTVSGYGLSILDKGWLCTKGHLLFGEKQNIHFTYSSSYSEAKNT